MTAHEKKKIEKEALDAIRNSAAGKFFKTALRNWVGGSAVSLAILIIWTGRGLFDEIKTSTSTNNRQDTTIAQQSVSLRILTDSNTAHGKRLWTISGDTLFIAQAATKPKRPHVNGPSVTEEE